MAGLIDLLIGTSNVLWRPDDPAGLAEVVGMGVVARMLREERRFREVVMVLPDGSSILVLPRLTSSEGPHDLREFTGSVVEAEVDQEHRRSDEVWDEFGRWLTGVLRRGRDPIRVHRGGDEHPGVARGAVRTRDRDDRRRSGDRPTRIQPSPRRLHHVATRQCPRGSDDLGASQSSESRRRRPYSPTPFAPGASRPTTSR